MPCVGEFGVNLLPPEFFSHWGDGLKVGDGLMDAQWGCGGVGRVSSCFGLIQTELPLGFGQVL